MMLAEMVHVLYSIVDRIYIGHLENGGTLALTGIGLCFPLITLISAFANLCSTGGTISFSAMYIMIWKKMKQSAALN